jgi:hypothetical protein
MGQVPLSSCAALAAELIDRAWWSHQLESEAIADCCTARAAPGGAATSARKAIAITDLAVDGREQMTINTVL